MTQPTLHKPIPMEARVIVPHIDRVGTVVGISSMHVVFTYIVLLDEPWEDQRAVVAHGPLLEGEDGSNWRI